MTTAKSTGPEMRARNIKPGFFKNEQLAECDPWARLCFAGLWCMADRDGILEDRPKRIKMELFPADSVDVIELIDQLVRVRLVFRYQVDGVNYICIPRFLDHQNPHYKEPVSSLPKPGKEILSTYSEPGASLGFDLDDSQSNPGHDPRSNGNDIGLNPGPASGNGGMKRGVTRLIPDSGSLIPDSGSLIPDSPPSPGSGVAGGKQRARRLPDDFTLTEAMSQYAKDYDVDPKRTFQDFTEYWWNRDDKLAHKLNWALTWQTWVRKAHDDLARKSQPRKTRYEQAMERIDGNQK